MRRSCSRLAAAIAGLREPREMETFLSELLTPSELHDLVLRWELLELLKEGVSQRKVAARLGVSLCKITRGAKLLKRADSVAARMLAQMDRRAGGRRVHAGTDVAVKPADKARR